MSTLGAAPAVLEGPGQRRLDLGTICCPMPVRCNPEPEANPFAVAMAPNLYGALSPQPPEIPMTLATVLALFGAGLLTFASPCVLPLLPMYLAVLAGAQSAGGDEAHAKRRLRLAGLGFSIGLSAVFVVLGLGASAVASTLAQYRQPLGLAAGFLMLLFGAKLIGVLRIPWFEREARPFFHRVPNVGGFGGGVLFGAAFALGWTPCVGPVLGAALTYAAASSADPYTAGAMLAAYALGLSAPLLAASFAASHLLVLTKRLRRYTPAMQRVTGALLVGVGALLATGTLSVFTPTAQTASGCDTATTATACDTQLASVANVPGNVDELPRGPALVEFVSGQCTACKKMHPIVSELEQRCPSGLITRVSIDNASGRSLAEHYGVTLVPTFVRIDAEGRELERIVGEQPKRRLVLALNELNGAPCDATL